jgi:predicted  nucleic acid-binding Zn-ribbon protein
METATSAAQITALEHEINFSEQAIAKLEDEELASLDRTDQHEITRGKATLTLEVTTATLAAERVRSADIVTRNKAAIDAIETERVSTRALIDEARLSVYDRIAKAKGTGLSEAIDHKCAACQMMVRPQRWNDLTDRDPNSEYANTIFTCETCGRMLFYDPRQDAPIRWTPGEKLSAATTTH